MEVVLISCVAIQYFLVYQSILLGMLSRKNTFRYRWEGAGVDEVGIEEGTGKIRIQVDPKYYRPTEVVSLNCFFSSYPVVLRRKLLY